MSVKPLATGPAPAKRCDSPWSDVSMRALIQVEDRKFLLVIRFPQNLITNKKNSIVIKLGTCTLSINYQLWAKYYIVKVGLFIVECILAIKFKPIIYKRTMIQTLFFVWMWRTPSCSLYKQFGYILYHLLKINGEHSFTFPSHLQCRPTLQLRSNPILHI